jgi:2'-5' RNA ligase
MPEATQTAVIVPVSAAEAVVAQHRQRLDVAASWGVPAHVTVLYPFVPPGQVDETVIDRLTAVFAAASPFTCTFDRCGWFGEDVLWLASDHDEEFRDLTDAVVERFPGHRPYGGQFDEVVPHLTVGESRRGTTDDLRAAAAEVSTRLPVTARIDHALLIAGTDQPDSWRTVAELPFGGPRPVPAALSGR